LLIPGRGKEETRKDSLISQKKNHPPLMGRANLPFHASLGRKVGKVGVLVYGNLIFSIICRERGAKKKSTALAIWREGERRSISSFAVGDHPFHVSQT